MTRLNKFLAQRLNISRRKADSIISEGLITVNGKIASNGVIVNPEKDIILYNQNQLPAAQPKMTILFNKPIGFVCSRNGQNNNTIYDILPEKYHHLNPIGRLDKNSGGLLVLTNDGDLSYNLSHPSNQKLKIYIVSLDKPLKTEDEEQLSKGVELSDGPSRLLLSQLGESRKKWNITLHEGRNRQIRRSFDALGYKVTKLVRTKFGDFSLILVPGQRDILEIS